MKKFWEIWNAVLDKSLDIGYAISDKVSEGVDKLMKRSQESNQARKLSGWMRSHVEAELELPSVEGIVYTKKGNISAKTGKDALDALEASLGGTAKQLEKRNPEEYERRIAAHKVRVRADEADKAFEEFLDWYNSGDNKKHAHIMMSSDPMFDTIIKVMGSNYAHNQKHGSADPELIKNSLDTFRRIIDEEF